MSRFALISVSDKTGLDLLAPAIVAAGYQILSTGGTARFLREHGITVTDVAEHTGGQECFDGRVKTLHPRIHGGILFDRLKSSHVDQSHQLNIPPIDLVVCNLYPFEKTIAAADVTLPEAVEQIDIGGPAMLRAAAKNFSSVAILTDPADYPAFAQKLADGGLDETYRRSLSTKAFSMVAHYNKCIADFLADANRPLRYGENPHQAATLSLSPGEELGFSNVEVLGGKQLSFNNYLDLNAATLCLLDLYQGNSVVIVKHNNPCGASTSKTRSLAEVYEKALAGDPMSAFGGIIACNQSIDAKTAELMSKHFLECIIAPDFDNEAREIFATKKNLRLVKAPWISQLSGCPAVKETRSILGGALIQERDHSKVDPSSWQSHTSHSPSALVMESLELAANICKHVKSNAIVLVKGGMTIGIGAGQMSRIDATELALTKAKQQGHDPKGAVAASDAFFPFPDCAERLAEAGISAIIHPGGSKRDGETVAVAESSGMSLFTSGQRQFRH